MRPRAVEPAKILFLTADLGGNIPPTVAVAEALVRSGAEVEILGLNPGRTTLPQIPYPPATAIKPVGRPQGLREARAVVRLMTSRQTSAEVVELIAEHRADLVVVDCMVPAMIRGASAAGVPIVVLFHTFGEFWTRSFDRSPVGRLLGLFGLRPRRLWARAAKRLILTAGELDPGRYDPALTGYTWTGTTEIGAEPLPRDAESVTVLVALSSTDFPGMLKVYRRIIAALSELPVEAIVTTGGVDLGGELLGDSNVEVRGWVDHDRLLPTVDLVIGHGGHSTTMKALAHGVPLLVLPVIPISDQPLVGRVIEAAGLGRCLSKSANPQRIRESVQSILADTELRERVAATGRSLRAQPRGAEVAADRIVDLLHPQDSRTRE